MADHKRRFERWRGSVPENTAYLVDQVLLRVLPEFENKGFVWYANHTGDVSKKIGASEIPLQKRDGKNWPTVHISFGKRTSPWFVIGFSVLPPLCRQVTKKGLMEIPREEAIYIESEAYFSIRKGKYSDYRDGEFGYSDSLLMPFIDPVCWFRFRNSYKKFIDSEIDEVISLLPEMFEVFDTGIPEAWLNLPIGHVSKHVMLMGSWNISEKRISTR